MKSESGATGAQNTNMMERRAFLIATGATLATIGSAGLASAASGLNYSNEVVPNPTISGTVTIAEHQGANMSSPLAYVDDNGDTVSFEDIGGRVAEAEDTDTPHNPITLRADRFGTDEFSAFPRGETFENADGDDEDVTALASQHWSTDESGSSGSITLADVETPANTDALNVSTSSQGDGDTALATFSDFSLDSGIPRKYIQLVVDVDAIDDGAAVNVRVIDSADNQVEATIDTGADSSATETIATATGAGIVFQEQIGEFSTELDDVVELELAVVDGNADVTIAGLNLERESRWAFGEHEFTNSDDEIETETIREPTGEFSITSLGSLGDVFSDADLADLAVDVEFPAAELPDSTVEYDFVDAGRYDQDYRFQVVYGWDLPSAYVVSYGDLDMTDTVFYPSSRYLGAEFATTVDEVPTLEDVDDVDWTDRSTEYGNASLEDEITLSTSISGGETIAWHGDVLVTDSEREDAEASSGGGGGGARGTSSAWWQGWSGVLWGTVATLIGAVTMRVRKLSG